MARVYPLCRIGVQLCNSISFGFICELALAVCQNTQFAPVIILNPGINVSTVGSALSGCEGMATTDQHLFCGCVQVYDIRKKCEGPLCYDFSRLEQYINQVGRVPPGVVGGASSSSPIQGLLRTCALLCLQPSVRKELGVGDRLWEACDMQVHAGEPAWKVIRCVLRTVKSGLFSYTMR